MKEIKTNQELVEKIFPQNVPRHIWRKLEEFESLKNLALLTIEDAGIDHPIITGIRPEVIQKKLTGNINLGLSASFATSEKHAADIASRVGGKIKQGEKGYFVSVPIDAAIKMSKGLAAMEMKKGQPSVREHLENIIVKVGTNHKFHSYAVDFEPASKVSNNLKSEKKMSPCPNIGKIGICHTWEKKPSIDAPVPTYIQNAAVRLPQGMTAEKYEEMCSIVQQGAITNKGISESEAQNFALSLGGIVIEATLPYSAQNLLKDVGPDVDVHCIFQSGLNFGGVVGGGVAIDPNSVSDQSLKEYIHQNAKAAIDSAINNQSDVLVFNIGIGSGFFGGSKKSLVKQLNIDTLCDNVLAMKAKGKQLEVVVPYIGYTEDQEKQLNDAGIFIAKGDKGAVAALCARQGLKVSETFAGDPMTLLGIHGPGLWWESVGSASDEERAAYLTPCYEMAHIPIDICEPGMPAKKIPALNQHMIQA